MHMVQRSEGSRQSHGTEIPQITPARLLSTTSTNLLLKSRQAKKPLELKEHASFGGSMDVHISIPPASPPIRRNLKRSASTASLPTPPRTRRRHAPGRSRGPCDSNHDAFSSEDDEGEVIYRTGDAVEAAEDAFWLGESAETAASSSKASATKQLDVPLLYRPLFCPTTVDFLPVSPPPSLRKSTVVLSLCRSESPSPTSPSTPRTPTNRSRTQKGLTLRDSPNNPFLDTPQRFRVADDDDEANSNIDPFPSRRSPVTEKPTLTYVFRGVRRVFQNPLYNHEEGRPYSPPPESKLPIDDPEYSPAFNCTPKLLFPEAHRANARARARGRLLEHSPSIDEDDDLDMADIRPKLLTFGAPKNVDPTFN